MGIARLGCRSGQETVDRVRNIKYKDSPAPTASQCTGLLELGMMPDRLGYASKRSAGVILQVTKDWVIRARAECIAEQVRMQRALGLTRRDVFPPRPDECVACLV